MTKVIETTLGLSFIYFMLSVMCSALNESIAGLVAFRAWTLRSAIANLLGSAALQEKLYDHSLIKSLCYGHFWWHDPSYIPSDLFAAALTDLLPRDKSRVPSVPEGELDTIRESMGALIDDDSNDLRSTRLILARWFDEAMARVSGTYKRRSQAIAATLAVLICVAANADTIAIQKSLWTDDVLRTRVAQDAADAIRAKPVNGTMPPGMTDKGELRKINDNYILAMNEVTTLGLPLGWPAIAQDAQPQPNCIVGRLCLRSGEGWGTKLVGLILSAVAVAMGAPFWFDLLSKFVNLRSSGTSPSDKAAGGKH
jgi:hypothetical protein